VLTKRLTKISDEIVPAATSSLFHAVAAHDRQTSWGAVQNCAVARAMSSGSSILTQRFLHKCADLGLLGPRSAPSHRRTAPSMETGCTTQTSMSIRLGIGLLPRTSTRADCRAPRLAQSSAAPDPICVAIFLLTLHFLRRVARVALIPNNRESHWNQGRFPAQDLLAP
jgi:hypothetical protein